MATIFIHFVVAKATVHNVHLTVFMHDIVIFVASCEITALSPFNAVRSGGYHQGCSPVRSTTVIRQRLAGMLFYSTQSLRLLPITVFARVTAEMASILDKTSMIPPANDLTLVDLGTAATIFPYLTLSSYQRA
jgi:hypothetical protein